MSSSGSKSNIPFTIMFPDRPLSSPSEVPPQRPRFLSEDDCHEIAERLARYAKGGENITVTIMSRWIGNVRWARNRITTTGEDRNNKLRLIVRNRGAAASDVDFNDVSDVGLAAAVRRAERLVQLNPEMVDYDAVSRSDSPIRPHDEPAAVPNLFSDATYQLDTGRRAETARQLIQPIIASGMLSAGYLEVSATSMAHLTSLGYAKYYQYTWAQYSVSVRHPKGISSGWAGVDWPDWRKIDAPALTARALEKCLTSRNPVAIEPGRYTTILEPQAVCDFAGLMMFFNAIGREANEVSPEAPFRKSESGNREPPDQGSFPIGYSRLGEKVIDERITISTDPMDPELGFPPYPNFFVWPDSIGAAYHPAIWIEHGVLKQLAYDRRYAIKLLGHNQGLPNPGAFRMSGGNTSIEEMIATTKRGVLVTRFNNVSGPFGAALLCRGYTRDGLWLIENGKISKPVKNMLFTESILFALNNVEQLGTPSRAFHPPEGGPLAFYGQPQPAIVPPLKIRDFSFTALSDAV
jgi:predicted Zn-dependent protease